MPDQSPTTLLITGATGGMGSACARLAASRGYNLILSDLNEDKLKALTEECAMLGVKASYYVLDVCNTDNIALVADGLSKGEGIDGLIHTVGLSPQMAPWNKIIEVDLIGTVEFLVAIKPALKTGAGAVCISSMSGHMVPPNPEVDAALANPLEPGLLERAATLADQILTNPGIAYAYSKKALTTYVKAQAMSWGQEGKRIVSISPGLIETDMGKLESDNNQESHAAMRKLIALRRDGQAQEIASAALFLVSREASYISGCDLLVDGGFVGTMQSQQQAG